MGKEYCLDHLVEVAKSIVLAIHKAPQITGKTKIEAEIIWGGRLRADHRCHGAGGQSHAVCAVGL